MSYLNLFKKINNESSILIVNDLVKDKIINIKSNCELALNELFSFKIVSETEFINLITFDINNDLYLSNLEKGIKPKVTSELIKFSKYNLENKNNKLFNFIKDNNKYLIKNESFFNNKENFKYYSIGLDIYIKPFINYYNLNYEQLKLNINEREVTALEFSSLEREVFYTFTKISELINNGVNINNIYIANTDSSYTSLLAKASSLFKINISNLIKSTLFEVPFINKLLNYNYDELIEILNNDELLNNIFYLEISFDKTYFYERINDLINIINKYSNSFNKINLMELIKLDAKNKTIRETTEGINLIDVLEVITLNENDYVFILNAKYESFPSIVKNNELLSDLEKDLISYPNSSLINFSNNNLYLNLLNNESIKYISYPKKDKYLEFDSSDIFSSLTKNNVSFSLEDFNVIYAKEYYKYFFSTNNKDDLLLTTFTGDFKISEEDKVKLSNYIKESNILLTPSSITTYFKIPFIYYLERVLKISRFNESVNLHIGNFYHLLIEVLLVLLFEDKVGRNSDFSRNELLNKRIVSYIIKKDINDFDYDLYFDEFYHLYFNEIFKEENELSIKSLFFVRKNKDLIIEALKFVIEFEEFYPSDELLVEKLVETNNFRGVADLVKLVDNKYTIIDYKTGNRSAFNKDKIINVIDDLLNDNIKLKIDDLDLLQPVFYAYFLSKINDDLLFSDISFLSIFQDKLKLNGLMTDKLSNKFYTGGNKRILALDEEKELFKKVEELINKTEENILNSKFNVNVLKDSDNKVHLDKSWFSVYEAIAYFYRYEEIEDEE